MLPLVFCAVMKAATCSNAEKSTEPTLAGYLIIFCDGTYTYLHSLNKAPWKTTFYCLYLFNLNNFINYPLI